ncbi:MAG: RNA methyltransferase [Bacteroidota bacterium]
MKSPNRKDRIDFLKPFITEERLEKIIHHVQYRTRHITVVIEDVFQPHNASAVLRSCDCFGVQDVHIIENKNQYQVNQDVALGSAQWLSLHTYNKSENNTNDCFQNLRKKGYRIIATTPHANDIVLQDFDVSTPFALVFGTEKDGLSSFAIENADSCIKIPMYGFTESLNISVSAAICLHFLTMKIRSEVKQWSINFEEQEALILEWLHCSIKHSDVLEREFEKNF